MTATSDPEVPGLPRILIVDDSRIVRATIIKRIRDRFSVREEADGEAGWEALLVDPTIQLVVTDHSMPRLDGFGLIERIRASRVARIREMPVIMISGDEDEESRQRAKDIGATDFITKGIGTAELLARLDALVNLGRTQGELQAARADAPHDPLTGILTTPALIERSVQVFSFAHRHHGPIAVLLIGLDGLDAIIARAGPGAVGAGLRHVANLLLGHVRREDLLGRWYGDRLALVAPGIDGIHAIQFAERLRAALAGSAFAHAGEQFRPTVTVGLAASPDEGQTLDDLAANAGRRLDRGQAEGGNRVVGGRYPEPSAGTMSVDEALAALAAGRVADVKARLPALGQRLMPLLGLLAAEFRFELPVSEILRRAAQDSAGTGEGSTISTT